MKTVDSIENYLLRTIGAPSMDVATRNIGRERILVVDDEALNLEIIADYMEETNYELIEAQDGFEAWEILKDSPESIDLVLLDRMLPGLNGMQILSKMKEHTVLKHIPVILQTAKAAKEDVLQGMQAGAFYYLTKPFEEEMLISVVKTALDERRYYVSLQEELKKTSGTLSLMKDGCFQFKTLKEAQNLALFISNACPNPEQSLTGLSELMVNAVEHGNLGITYAEKTELVNENRWESEVQHRLTQPEYSEKSARLLFQLNDNYIQISVEDMGTGFNWHDYLEIAIERAADNHGRGIAMAKVISFDSIEYHGIGNKVTATINFQKTSVETIEQQEELVAI